jgi:hypothetical protein
MLDGLFPILSISPTVPVCTQCRPPFVRLVSANDGWIEFDGRAAVNPDDLPGELEVSETEPIWLGGKPRILFEAFMDAWSVAASRSNIRSGFKACGICPLDLEQPLNNQFTAPVFSGSVFRPAPNHPTDLNCALVTSPQKLAILKQNHGRVVVAVAGAEMGNPVIDYGLLLAAHDPAGCLLSAPTPHFRYLDVHRYSLANPADGPRYLAYA